MLVFQIKSANGSATPTLFSNQPPDSANETGRLRIFLKSIKNCHFKIGRRVRQNNTNKKGVIADVKFDIKDVQWGKNNMPMYIEVKWDSGEATLCHPSQLSYKRAT